MKTNKNALIALIAVAISTVSCVDNEVSPQVEAIREQQVEWMKAKTGTELALAEMKKAETAYQIAETARENALTAGILELNAFDKADNVWKLKTKELLYTTAVADNAADVKEAEERLAKADLNLKEALNDLALAVAASKDDQAQMYYANYAAEANKLSNLYTQRLNLQSSIANNTFVLSTDTGTLNNFLKVTQIDIDSDKALLVSQKAALATLKAVIADPTSIETEINTLNSANITLNASKDKLNVEEVKATNERNVAQTVYSVGTAIIVKMEGYKSSLNNVELAIATQDKTIIDEQKDLSDALSILVAEKLVLTNAQAVYTEKKAFFDARVTVHVSAKATKAQTLSTLKLKEAATVSAQLKFDEDNSVANATALSNAQLAENTALTADTTAQNNLDIATTNMNAAAVPYQTAKLAVSIAENNVDTAQSNATQADADLLAAKNAKSTNAAAKARLESQIAALTTSFNTESAKQFANAEDIVAKNLVITKLSQDISAISTTISQNNNVINSLTASKNNIEGLKAAAKTQAIDIAATEESIAKNTSLLTTSSAANAKAATEANIAKLTEELKAVNLQIDAAGKLAKYWKDLLDKIFTV